MRCPSCGASVQVMPEGQAAAPLLAGGGDNCVRLLPPQKLSKRLAVGEFTQARIVATEASDGVGVTAS